MISCGTQTSGLSAAQMKAGRALLDWTQEELAIASNLSIATIRKLELGHISPRHSTTKVIREAMENAGLEFIEPDGVRRQNEDVTVYQGLVGIELLIEDIRHTTNEKGGDIAIIASADTVLFSSKDINSHCRIFGQMTDQSENLRIKCLLTDTSFAPLSRPKLEFCILSRNYIDPTPLYIYGDKHALVVKGSRMLPQIIIVRSFYAAQAARRQFNSMWDMATALPALMRQSEVTEKASVFA